ncbi:MAG TPA: ABC transporter permease [Ramlibacter sp.]
MFGYYFMLGVRSLRRNPVITSLMVLTLAVGVAASVSTLTILHVMSGDPIPGKSDRLLVPLLDPGPANTYVPGKKNPYLNQSTYRDSLNYLASGQGVRRTVMFDVGGSVEPAHRDQPLVDLSGIATTADFFPMFEVPFLHGNPWTADDDKRGAQVAVLSKKASEKLFGKVDPVGRRIRIWNTEFTVGGVLADWHPLPRYDHLVNGSGGQLAGEDEILVPFRTAIALQLQSNGSVSCSADNKPGYQGLLDSECVWLQPWFELASAADRPALQSWLDAYVADQRKLGRLERHAPNRLFDVMQWIGFMDVVEADQKASVWLSFGFLLLCMVNTMGLLLAKFAARAPEVGVRRALGASRLEVFQQFLLEAGVVGFAGGLLGLALAGAALWAIGEQSKELSVAAHMDWAMLAATFAIAVAASLLAGLLPTWRAAQVTPALQLKSQ